MKRSMVLAVVMGIGALSLAAVAAQDGLMVIEVEQLEDNLYVLRGQGGGGNTAVFITSGGVVVVDSKNPGWGPSILEAIGRAYGQPGDHAHQHAQPSRSRERQRRVSRQRRYRDP